MEIESELFRELLRASDRDRIPGAAPIVSYREDENEQFARDLKEHAVSRVDLSRRGVWHGRWAELEARALSPTSEEPDLRDRWRNSRPIVLRGVLKKAFADIADDTELALTRFRELKRPEELKRWINAELAATKPSGAHFRVLDKKNRAETPDRERDIDRIDIQAELKSKAGEFERYDDLWVKVGQLSNSKVDSSIRARFSFGREIEDDANPDEARNRLVAELATRCLPAAARIRDNAELKALYQELAERPLYATQHIAYWNAPEGGALFHHDAFDRPGREVEATQQLGVLFAQASGRTAWLALSIQDLAQRVREFLGHLSDGQLHWVRAAAFSGPSDFQSAFDLAAKDEDLIEELSKPGCGLFATLVNRGPEFTAFLADCGHACVLRPGDAILLPNKHTHNTTMHSVFCASPDLTYGISCGLRAMPGGKPLSTEVVKRGKGFGSGDPRRRRPRKK